MYKIFLGLFLTVGLFASDVKKVIYDLETSKLSTLESRFIKGVIANKNYYKSNNEKLDVLVIIHGGAYKFFLKDISKTIYKDDKEAQKVTSKLHEKLKSLSDNYNIKIQMCQVGAKKRKLKSENILPFIEMAPSAVIALIDAQNNGYAYVPID